MKRIEKVVWMFACGLGVFFAFCVVSAIGILIWGIPMNDKVIYVPASQIFTKEFLITGIVLVATILFYIISIETRFQESHPTIIFLFSLLGLSLTLYLSVPELLRQIPLIDIFKWGSIVIFGYILLAHRPLKTIKY